jgi:hypothetical protein
LVAVKLAILPEPLAANPIDGVLFVQLNVVPATVPVKFTGAVGVLLHTVWFGGWFTSGIGLTNTVAVIDGPGQPLAVGVIVNVTVNGELVRFVNVPLISPDPLAAIPVTVATLSLTQPYVVPATGLPLNTIVVIADPEQIVCEDGVAVALGVGLTNTVAVTGVPAQPLAVGVMVKVTVTGAFVVFVNVPLISPDPLAAMPVTATVLSLTQLYTVPATLPVIAIVVIGVPEHLVCEAGLATALGVGLTVIVNDFGVPEHVTGGAAVT